MKEYCYITLISLCISLMTPDDRKPTLTQFQFNS